MREYDSGEASVVKRRSPKTKKYTIVSKEKNSAYLMGLRMASGNLVSDGRKVQIMKEREQKSAKENDHTS